MKKRSQIKDSFLQSLFEQYLIATCVFFLVAAFGYFILNNKPSIDYLLILGAISIVVAAVSKGILLFRSRKRKEA